MNDSDKKSVVVNQSPVVIVKNFIIAEIFAGILYFVGANVAHYSKLWRQFSFDQFLSFQIAEMLFFIGAEIVIVVFIFLDWYRRFYRIKSDSVTAGSGLIIRRRKNVLLDTVVEVSHEQGLFGQRLKYGTVYLKDRDGKIILKIPDIPDPQEYSEIIMQYKKAMSFIPAIPPGDVPELAELISKGEHNKAEFKSTLRWDVMAGKVNTGLEKATIKTVAAFLNSQGGHLLLGVDDSRQIVGLEQDYRTLQKKSADGFENHFSNIFNSMIGSQFRHLVQLHWAKSNDRECCIVSVAPSTNPVYLKDGQNEEFYIRTGNGTNALKVSQATSYIQTRFARQT